MFGAIQKYDENRHIRKEYARLALKYDKKWSFYNAATVTETIKRLDLKPPENLLDICCGTGTLLSKIVAAFPGVQAAGIDLSPEMLDIARQKLAGKATLKECLAEAIPFNDQRFDIVVSCNSFHFWRNPDKVLDEIKRVLKPKGRVVITDWCNDYLLCRLYDIYLRRFNRAYHKSYGVKECEALLASKHFSGAEIKRYKINWFWGMMAAKAKVNLLK